jgi:hypothetical protein
MPYALLATDGRLFAGLADGLIWESPDRGDTWSALRLDGDPLGGLIALGRGLHCVLEDPCKRGPSSVAERDKIQPMSAGLDDEVVAAGRVVEVDVARDVERGAL